MKGESAQNYNATRSFCCRALSISLQDCYCFVLLILFFLICLFRNLIFLLPPPLSIPIPSQWDGTDSISPISTWRHPTQAGSIRESSPITSNTNEIQFWDFNQDFLPNDIASCWWPLHEKILLHSGVTQRKEERDGQRSISVHGSICILSHLMLV